MTMVTKRISFLWLVPIISCFWMCYWQNSLYFFYFSNFVTYLNKFKDVVYVLRWHRTARCDFARSQLFGFAQFLPSFLAQSWFVRLSVLLSVIWPPMLLGINSKAKFHLGHLYVIDPRKHLRRLTYRAQ